MKGFTLCMKHKNSIRQKYFLPREILPLFEEVERVFGKGYR